MTHSFQGNPCWYELATSDPDAAQAFYAAVLDWTTADSGMPGMDYRLAKAGGSMVAGITQASHGAPAAWITYFAVTGCDDTFAQATDLGARSLVPPTDIPDTGRFALLADPQGAAFGILQPLPMPDGSIGEAFNQQKQGHGHWHDLVTADPKRALEFYATIFGWTTVRSVEMGPEMTYHVIGCQGAEIGGCFSPHTETPAPYWKPYFGITSATVAAALIPTAGGKVLRGPDEVPGGAYTLQVADPLGAKLGLSGPR
jgi:predicted enzyme related to lactoylglutathione lyase